METLFEYRQRDSSWGDNVELVEFKIFENGGFYYKIDIEGRFCKNETKPENPEFAECIKELAERQLKCVSSLPDILENEAAKIKDEFVKIGNKRITGHDWKRNYDYTGLSEELQDEDQLVQAIGIFKKFIDKFYPDFIDWSEVGDDWFEEPPEIVNYTFGNKYYLVSGNKIFMFDEEKGESVPADEITVSQLEMYGTCTDPTAIELKIKSIKEFKSPDWKALITADDGAGVEISFWDESYFDHPEIYKIGETGLYNLWASIENEPKPKKNKNGIILTAEEAEKYQQYLWDEDAKVKSSKYDDLAIFEKSDDFELTGKYKFRTVVSCAMYASDENGNPIENKFWGFDMPLMNQLDKEKPRRITAMFDEKNPFRGKLEGGMGLSGVLYLTGSKAFSKNICNYGENKALSFEEKYPDTGEWDED